MPCHAGLCTQTIKYPNILLHRIRIQHLPYNTQSPISTKPILEAKVKVSPSFHFITFRALLFIVPLYIDETKVPSRRFQSTMTKSDPSDPQVCVVDHSTQGKGRNAHSGPWFSLITTHPQALPMILQPFCVVAHSFVKMGCDHAPQSGKLFAWSYVNF